MTTTTSAITRTLWIAAPTGAGRHYADLPGNRRSWGIRGRAPRIYTDIEAARTACKGIEREGWQDGGRGRDCYIVRVEVYADGAVVLGAGNGHGGLSLGSTELTIGCREHVDDAAAWLHGRPRKWMVEHFGLRAADRLAGGAP
jgi:hypothetical protein